MRVVGTAGHVDHGKSTLIAALTGVHPDRLKEEREREMTIELGFGWLTLPNGEEVGVVDVPGHRDFIENMLAGVGGIDAALLVIAADEGVMPQTKEHLAILDLLQIPAGLVVLSKIDLVPDEDWLALAEADVRAALAGTVLESAPILRVSARQGAGLDSLRAALATLLESKPARLDLNRPRLPIDRVFTMSGFGTVVTGTLSDGSLSVGDEVEILPGGFKGRVRGLQTHKKKEQKASPGSRTAVNISGVEVEQIRRGDTLVRPNQYQAVRRVDARFRLLKDVALPLEHGDEVKFFVGASETMATLRLLGTERLAPGEEGWVQLELREPVVAVRGDRYILRRPSPSETLGGGAIVDSQPKGRHKRFDEAVLQSLAALSKGSPADVLFEAMLALGAAPVKEVVAKSRLEATDAQAALSETLQNGKLMMLEGGEPQIASDALVVSLSHYNALIDKVVQTVQAYHAQFPLRRGIPREELKSKLKLTPRLFNALLANLQARKLLSENARWMALPEHKIEFSPADKKRADELLSVFKSNPYAPPSVKECQARAGEEVFAALLELDELIQISPDVVFRKADYDAMVAQIRAMILQNGQVTLAEVRDLFGATRKYVQALLEHLDAIGVTVRVGDARKLK